MCLATITADKTTKRIGYKVLYHNNYTRQLETGVCGAKGILLPVGKYVKDPNRTPISEGNYLLKYPAGFHICLNKREAQIIRQHEGGVVCKVKFRKSVAVGDVHWCFRSGQTLSSKTVVAREVMLVGEDT